MKVLSGEVIKRDPSGFWLIECKDAPEHLKTMYLGPHEISTARVGDHVTLEYRSGPSFGLWRVVGVFPRKEPV